MGSGVSTMAKTKAKTLHPMMDRKLQEAASTLERTELTLADKSKVLAMQTTELRNVQTQLKETQQLLEREKIIQDKLKLRQTETLKNLRVHYEALFLEHGISLTELEMLATIRSGRSRRASQMTDCSPRSSLRGSLGRPESSLSSPLTAQQMQSLAADLSVEDNQS